MTNSRETLSDATRKRLWRELIGNASHDRRTHTLWPVTVLLTILWLYLFSRF